MEKSRNGTYQQANEVKDPSAAVAIIRCPVPRESILLVRRTHHPDDPWSGHFALPGGRKDPTDETILSTCTREVEEETGIVLVDDMLIETLPIHPAGRRLRSPILVQPFLFEVEQRPHVCPSALEIASYYWLETGTFLDRKNHIVTEVVPGMIRPVFPLADYYIWGFTYTVLCSLLGIGRITGTVGS